MPDYKYQGTSRAGASVSGVMTASNKTELANLLKRQQITATKMTEKGKEFNMPQFGGGVSAKELAIFTRQFSVMIDAGLPLVQCLEILASQQENKFFQKVLTGTRGQDLLKEFVFLLARQNFQALHERKTSVDHDRELAREDGQFLGTHATAELGHIEFLALLGHFGGSDLLALQQVRQFRLVGCGHDTADAGAGAAGSLIFVIRHVISS